MLTAQVEPPTRLELARRLVVALLECSPGPLRLTHFQRLPTTLGREHFRSALQSLRNEGKIVAAGKAWRVPPPTVVALPPTPVAQQLIVELQRRGGASASAVLRNAAGVSRSAFARAIKGLKSTGTIYATGTSVDLLYHLAGTQPKTAPPALSDDERTVLQSVARNGGTVRPCDLPVLCPRLPKSRARETARSLAVRGYLRVEGATNDRVYALA